MVTDQRGSQRGAEPDKSPPVYVYRSVLESWQGAITVVTSIYFISGLIAREAQYSRHTFLEKVL